MNIQFFSIFLFAKMNINTGITQTGRTQIVCCKLEQYRVLTF